MRVTGLRLRQQLSSGLDGARYLASDAQGRQLVVDRLQPLATQPERLAWLSQRVRLTSTLHNDAVTSLLQHDMESPVPYLVGLFHEHTLAAAMAGEAQLSGTLTFGIRRLASALAAAHRLGIAVGGLNPEGVLLNELGRPCLQLTGVLVSPPADSVQAHACLPPESIQYSYAADVYALGAIWRGASQALGRHDASARPSAAEQRLIERMLDDEPSARPGAAEIFEELLSDENTADFAVTPGALVAAQREAERSSAPAVEVARDDGALADGSRDEGQSDEDGPGQLGPGATIGRFRLEKMLGEGGMGRVYRALDIGDDSVRAVKLLHPRWAEDQLALARFYREARLLSQLDNPFIAKFVEVNHDRGIHYLAMELVTGKPLDEMIEDGPELTEQQVLALLADMARALADIHDLGIVHRDVKPANLLVREQAGELTAKLCDFGIARQMGTPEQAIDRVTRLGTAVGTPQYMAPEQCVGAAVDARSDIYALGITAYEMLARRLPFSAPTIVEVVMMQLNEAPPPLREARPNLSAPLDALIGRMLAKKPADRFANARELLDEVERLRRGGVEQIQLHPAIPEVGAGDVLAYDVELTLRGTPAELWPHVSNTERLNRAAGLGAVEFAWHDRGDAGRELRGAMRRGGLSFDWRENPFEWVAPHRMGVLREYDGGPFYWLRNTVQLSAQGEGTLLRHRVEVAPRGIFGRAAAAMEVGFRLRRGLERVYRSIDDHVMACRRHGGRVVLDGTALDPFEAPPQLEPEQRARLHAARAMLRGRGVAAEVVDALCDYLVLAPAQAVARIRPRVFARDFGLEPREVLHACFHAVKGGALSMLWNVLCPRCQVPASIEESLTALRDHAHCEACALDYGVDFGRSIEVVFAAHPSLRTVEQGSYCIGGPAHRPHVVAQVRLQAGARFSFDLELAEGPYQIAARELPSAWAFSVTAAAKLNAWDISLRRGLPAALPRTLAAGRQHVVLSNDYDHEIVARIERTHASVDAVTATEAACSALFRELFPSEVLAPGLLISSDEVALLQVALYQPYQRNSEANVFAELTELVNLSAEAAEREGGAVVKIQGDGVLASFSDPLAAARAGFRLVLRLESLRARVAIHCGAAMVTSINERIDYFGRVVSDTDKLIDASLPGEIAFSEAMQLLPGVGTLLREQPQTTSSRVIDVGSVVGLALSRAPQGALTGAG